MMTIILYMPPSENLSIDRRDFIKTTAATIAGLTTLESVQAVLADARGRGVAGKVIEVTDTTFEKEVLKSAQPVLVDFYADWCGPCRQMKPIIKELAREYAGRVKVVAIDVDENRIDDSLQVNAYPTFLIIKDGEVVDRIVGGGPKDFFRQRINAVLED
jgi:thioredoxin 1